MNKNNSQSAIFSTHPVDVFKKILTGRLKKNKFKFFNIDSPISDFISKLKNIKLDNLFLVSDLNKSFSCFDDILINNNKNLKKLDLQIIELVESLETASQFTKKLYFFSFPLDIDDNYFGDLNNKLYGKNWLINYINLQVGIKISNIDSISLIDTNQIIIKHKFVDNIFDEKMKYLIGSNYSPNFIKFL